MQGNNDNFQKTQKKNRQYDDGMTKQNNSKKFKKNFKPKDNDY